MKAVGALLFAVILLASSNGYAVDERAARDLARDNDCMKCHSISKKKDGPSYKEVAAKYKDKPDAVDILIKHVTTSPMVKVGDKEEKHKAVEGDPEEIRNLVEWILSL